MLFNLGVPNFAPVAPSARSTMLISGSSRNSDSVLETIEYAVEKLASDSSLSSGFSSSNVDVAEGIRRESERMSRLEEKLMNALTQHSSL